MHSSAWYRDGHSPQHRRCVWAVFFDTLSITEGLCECEPQETGHTAIGQNTNLEKFGVLCKVHTFMKHQPRYMLPWQQQMASGYEPSSISNWRAGAS